MHLVATLLSVTLLLPAPLAVAASPAAGQARAEASTSAGFTTATAKKGKPGAMARKYLGSSRSRHVWHSGGWSGGWMSAKNATAWGTWRGTPSDASPTFPERRTWADMANSRWHIDTFKGFRGTLVYGLPLLPSTAKPAQLKNVAAGRHDATFRTIARDLKRHTGGPVVVRIGWEANGNWMSFSTTHARAGDYKAAFRRAATVMKKENPKLVIDFDINCGTPLPGQRHRLDSLTRLYPGDDVVDLIGCDTYDWDVLKARTETQWRASLRPRGSVGIADVADFARARKKGLSFPEWGITHAWDGNGDNPFYIRKMKQFFDANNDILVLENYFNVPDDHMRSGLLGSRPQNPKAAAEYRTQFGVVRR